MRMACVRSNNLQRNIQLPPWPEMVIVEQEPQLISRNVKALEKQDDDTVAARAYMVDEGGLFEGDFISDPEEFNELFLDFETKAMRAARKEQGKRKAGAVAAKPKTKRKKVSARENAADAPSNPSGN